MAVMRCRIPVLYTLVGSTLYLAQKSSIDLISGGAGINEGEEGGFRRRSVFHTAVVEEGRQPLWEQEYENYSLAVV